MSMSTFEPKGVTPNAADQRRAQELCTRYGVHHAARRVGLSRVALLRIAAGCPIYLCTLDQFRSARFSEAA
jgi:hypothetical protein